jgi:NAD(P)-dependent dehydrogenase (short-subunit alcohol dehydrogenase family)
MTPGTALITGAARRIGRALALCAAECGYDVAIHHRDAAADAEALAEEIIALGRRAVLVRGDLADPEIGRLIGEAATGLGPVTLLVNNASLFIDDRIATLTAASFEAHLAPNLRAPILLTQAFAAALPKGARGLVVNIVDQRVTHPNPQFFSYTVSKSALWTATIMTAQALAPDIRVNAISPGPTLPSIHQSAEDFAAEAAAVPLQTGATPADIAQALRYLIDAPAVTGQMIAVDGGQHLAWRTPDIIGA